MLKPCFASLCSVGLVLFSNAALADDVAVPKGAAAPPAPQASAAVALAAPPGGSVPLEDAPTPGAVPAGALEPVAGGLLADQVAVAAAGTSHEVRAKEADVLAAEHSAKQAWLSYFPRLSVAGTYTRLSPVEMPVLGVLPNGQPLSIPVFLNNTSLQGSLAVPLTDLFLRIPQAYASAKNAANAAKFNADAARLQTATEARATYYSWVRTRLQVVVATLALEQAKAHLGIVVAHASPADIARVESQVAALELVGEKTKNYVAVTEDRLRTIMHDTTGKRYELGENIKHALPPLPPADLPKLWEEAASQRLEVKALGELVESQRLQADAVKAGRLPRLDAIGNILTQNPNPRIFPQQDEFTTTWDLSLRLSWSPNDAAASHQGGSAVDARAAGFLAQRAALLDGLRSEVTATYTAVREADVAVGTTTRGLTFAEESYRIRNELFKVGRATSVELTDAEADLTRARIEAIGARIDQRIARARLLHALGRDVAGAEGASAEKKTARHHAP